MRSRLYVGKVVHERRTPVVHAFEYPVYYYGIELDELPALDRELPMFGYNRRRIVSFYDKDYLWDDETPIKEKVRRALRAQGYDFELGRVLLVTSPRFLGRLFNPVSFYYIYDSADSLRLCFAEVNNTSGERVLYVLPDGGSRSGGEKWKVRALTDKQFYVSPFYKVDGVYDFRFADPARDLDVRVNIVRDGKPDFVSRVWGTGTELTRASHKATLLRYPLTALLTIPRIYYQALQLFFRRRVRVQSKPNPPVEMTIRAEPFSWTDKICRHFLRARLRKVQGCSLRVVGPDGRTEMFGDPASAHRATVTLRNFEIYRKVVANGSIGLGESYVDGDWDTDSLPELLKIFLNNCHTLHERSLNWAFPFRWASRAVEAFRRNSLKGSQSNIQAHYDLGNKLFENLLDDTMTYSCGVFPNADTTLEEAQKIKIRMMLEKAKLTGNEHILEIGSGWGALAIEAAERYGCKVTTITLSDEQLRKVRQRVAERGLEDRIEVKLCDYRRIEGKYDRVISVEMLEAVGYRYLGRYFKAIERALKPDGLAVIQVITFPDSSHDSYRRRTDWIQKHIFPGSHLPSLSALHEAMRKNSDFLVEELENIGPHYAPTLAVWRRNLLESRGKLKLLGYDERFIRMWNFYFASCEAQFATRWLNVVQLVLTRPNNRFLMALDRGSRIVATEPDTQFLH